MDIMKLLHAVDPYDGLTLRDEDLQGWGGHPDLFERVIASAAESAKIHRKRTPMTIVEVGTWKGRSAVSMADACKRLGIDAKIVCVDTWLGATEFWTNHEDKKRYKSLGLVNGYPTVYYQFLSNVVRHGHKDVIVPFPQTSMNAARFFKKSCVSVDLVYIDASHEFQDVCDDLSSWQELLSDGGVMFGDDYCEHWDGVRRGVDSWFFGSHEHVRLENTQGEAPSDYWIAPPAKCGTL